MTLPSWISAAAAFVTAGVTRFVAPVWSFGPQGDGGTSFLQSVWATAPEAERSSSMPAARIEASFMTTHSFSTVHRIRPTRDRILAGWPAIFKSPQTCHRLVIAGVFGRSALQIVRQASRAVA